MSMGFLPLAVGAVVLIGLVLFAFGDGGSARLKKRAQKMEKRLHTVISPVDLQLRRQMGESSTLDRLVHRLTPQPDRLRQRLASTGKRIGLGAYGLTCFGVALLFFVAAMVLGLTPLAALPLGLLAGLWFPHLAIGFLAKRRMKGFANVLPEAIALMVRSIKSGLPITEAFQIVGREVADPVGMEFRQLCDETRLGKALDQALLDLAKRVGVAEMKFLVSTLAVQRETGGNLAETLENLDTILRRRRQMRLKVKALSSEARASAMIIGCLPFIMACVLSAADHQYLLTLFTDHLGNMILAGGSSSMGLGTIVMWRMVRFEI